MPDLPISGLPVAGAVASLDEFAINQKATTVTKKVTAAQIQDLVLVRTVGPLFVPAIAGYNITDMSQVAPYYIGTMSGGIPFADNKEVSAYGHWETPNDYDSGLLIVPVLEPSVGGELYYQSRAYWGACEEAFDFHSLVPAWATSPTLHTHLECIGSIAPTPSSGDLLNLEFRRNADAGAGGASDTIAGPVIFVGWKVSYTAKHA